MTTKKLEEIDVDNLVGEMRKQDSLVNYYGNLLAKMEADCERMEAKLKVVKANISKRYRRKFNRSGEKVTEAQLNDLVITHTDVINVTDEYIEAKKLASIAKTKFKSILVRVDMVSNIGHMVRQEKEMRMKRRMKTGGK